MNSGIISNNHYPMIHTLPLRIFHWLLVVSIIGSYATAELGDEWLYWHIHFGILIFSLIIFRLIWGMSGPAISRFSSALLTLERIQLYYKSGNPGAKRSPHGTAASILLLCLCLAQSITGLFAIDDEIDITAPFYILVSSATSEKLTALHITLSNGLLWMIVLHLSAISFYFFILHKNLITPMMIGQPESAFNSRSEKKHNNCILSLTTASVVALTLFYGIESGVLAHILQQIFN